MVVEGDLGEEVEVIGYVSTLEPKVGKKTVIYRVKLTTLAAKTETMYLREIPAWLRLGIPVKVRATLSKQTGRYIIEEINIARGLPWFSPEESEIEEVSGEKKTIIVGKRRGRFFSLPISDQEIVSKLPRKLPTKAICLFLETSEGTRLASIIPEKEYKIIERAGELMRSMERDERRINKDVKRELSELIED